MAGTKAMKAQMGSIGDLIPKDYPSLGSPWLLSGLTSLYGRSRLADRLRVSNVTISNVPAAGAVVPGRREAARLVPAVDRRARRRAEHHDPELHGAAVLRPDRCRRAVPDVRDLADSLERAAAGAAQAAAGDRGEAPPPLPEPVAEKRLRRQPKLNVVEPAAPVRSRGARRRLRGEGRRRAPAAPRW